MDKPGLRDLQGAFWHAVSTDPGVLAADATLLATAAPSANLDASARLQVYVDAYFSRLRDVLADDFPRLATTLGATRFDELAREYLRAQPSTNPSLRHLGDALPAFLQAHTTLPAYLIELARLERARVEVFDAPDDVPLTVAALHAVPPAAWPSLRFVPIRALAIVRLAWPVLDLWHDPRAMPAKSLATTVRVWRGGDFRVFHAALDPRAARALEGLVAGQPFGAFCGNFGDLPAAEAAERATGLLARWLEDGLLARYVLPG